MPKIEIRPAVSPDINELINLDHSCKTNYVWQMDRNINEGQLVITFREIRLPRPIQVPYPRLAECLEDEWQLASGLLVAVHEDKQAGYLRMVDNPEIQTVVVKDVVVDSSLRRQGISARRAVPRHSRPPNGSPRDRPPADRAHRARSSACRPRAAGRRSLRRAP